MARDLKDLLTREEMAEIERMLSCTPQYEHERVALSAVRKLLICYEEVLDAAIAIARAQNGEPH